MDDRRVSLLNRIHEEIDRCQAGKLTGRLVFVLDFQAGEIVVARVEVLSFRRLAL
ncbi:MAG: hypothetical protein ACOZFS_05925 [Thermodesulfobacteriota bacterium]